MPARSWLVRMGIKNLGCIGAEGLEIALDEIVCLVGRNNAGKSTVLRAYELAATAGGTLEAADRCAYANGPTEVELWVHIPAGTPNIADRWIEEKDGLRLLRSRWQWQGVGAKPERSTWDPTTNEYADEGNAAGADTVFTSRLPKPIRVGSLQNADLEHSQLLKLITQPIAKKLLDMQKADDSPLAAAIKQVVQEAEKPVAEFAETIERASNEIAGAYQGIFPDLTIKLRIGMDDIKIDAAKQLETGSTVQVLEGKHPSPLRQQGTGSQRALFWALLQVRNRMLRALDLQKGQEKQAKAAAKKKPKADGAAAADDAKQDSAEDAIALPGYMLLIDEPENALHPVAARSARRFLYQLAADDDWQVIMSTHSPYFIDPLEDHTTIVRLERDGNRTTPRTYRADEIVFDADEKRNLKALLQMDVSLCEIFFGSHPIVVEGDTEYAAFLASVIEVGGALTNAATIVRARGKNLIPSIIKMVTHFKVSFSVLHDTDSPKRSDGKGNSAWTMNSRIADAIAVARAAGLTVRHQVSVPDFERRFQLDEAQDDKPWHLYESLKADETKRAAATKLFEGLVSGDSHLPFDAGKMKAANDVLLDALQAEVRAWAAANNLASDDRYQFGPTPDVKQT